MIQELFGSGLISGERRIHPITTNGTTILPPPSYSHNHHHSSPSPSPSTATTSTTAAASLANSSTPSSSSSSTTPSGDHQHLRCPRCDSSNTKFCYYNNYNLTQPRHFCKTCRRYWTKGGALRNVPIGGGCRKNRINTTTGLIPSSSSTAKLKSLAVEFGNSSSSSSSSPSLFGASLYDLHHESLAPSSPILWSSPQTNSHHHFLSLLRPSPNPRNPNPNPSSTTTLQPTSSKHEANHGLANLFGTSTTTATTTTPTTHLFEPSSTTTRTLGGWDSASPVNNNNSNRQQQQQAANSLGLNYPPIPIWMGDSNGNGYLVGSDEPHHNNTGYDVFNDGNNNVGSTSAGVASSSSTVAPVAGGGGGGFVGYSWNPAAFTSSSTSATTTTSWSDLPTTANNGTAYP